MPPHGLRPWGGSWGQRPFRPYDGSMGHAASGHLEQLPSGSFRVEVHAGTDPLTGRRLRFRQTVRTEEQARIVLGRLLEQASAGQRPDSGVTVAELLARYMAVAELDPSTQNTYAGYIRRTILPALGSMELRKVRGPLLDTFYARLRRCGDLTCTGKPFTEHRTFLGLTIEPGNARSAWRRASAAIRDAAGSGQLAPGEQLPSVRELAAQHGLPVAAVRRALEELAREGVIIVHHGRRATVSGGPGTVSMPRLQAGDAGHDCASAGCQPHRCRPMSPRTIRQIHAILSGAFAAAVRWEWIDRNPAASAKPPKTRHRSPTSPTPTDVAAVIAARVLPGCLSLRVMPSIGVARGDFRAVLLWPVRSRSPPVAGRGAWSHTVTTTLPAACPSAR
jgi:Bacterial regulatory proteins, gntR family/Phage integrase, N-terminal SAM-like domain